MHVVLRERKSKTGQGVEKRGSVVGGEEGLADCLLLQYNTINIGLRLDTHSMRLHLRLRCS